MSRNAPQLPNNSGTPSFIEVTSASGFAAGDYTYYNNGTVGLIPGNATSTGTFSVVQSVGSYSQGAGGVANVANSNIGGASSGGSSKMPRYAAILSNGNIVSVFAPQTTLSPSFRIDTPAGASVVATTNMAPAGYPPGNGEIGVSALSGGGFVIYWANTSGYITYSVYSNTGTVVKVLTNDYPAGQALGGNTIQGVSLANGGFVLGFLAGTGPTIYYRIYDATGTALYAWTSLGALAKTSNMRFGMAARSDSSFCIAYAGTSGTVVNYYLISATNTAITNATISKTVAASAEFVDVCTLTNNTFVISYIDNITPTFNLLPTGNTLGSAVTLTNAQAGYVYGVTSCRLAAGGFVIAFQNQYWQLEWVFFTATGAQVSPSTNYVQKNCLMGKDNNSTTCPTLLEVSGVVNMYYANGALDASFYPYTQAYCTISQSTYALIPFGTTQNTAVASTTAAVSGYAKAASTPSYASFLAANTQTLSLSTPQITGSQTPSLVSGGAYNSMHSCSLLNGAGFAVIYGGAGGYTLTLLNASGVITGSTTVSSSGYNFALCCRVAVLSNGNIVVAWVYGGGGASLYASVYTPALSLVAGPTNVIGDAYTSPYAGSNTNYSWGMTGIYGNKIAFGYINTSTQAAWLVVNSSLGGGSSGTISGTSSCYSANVGSCITAPGFWFSYNNGNVGQYTTAVFMKANSANTGYSTAGTPLNLGTGSSYYIATNTIPVTGNNLACVPTSYASSANYVAYAMVGDNQQSSYGFAVQYSSYIQVQNSCIGWGISGTGNLVGVTIYNNNSNSGAAYQSCFAFGPSNPSTTIGSSTFYGITGYQYPQTSVCALSGDTMVVTWLDYTQKPNFLIFNSVPNTYTLNLVAGVTPSAASFNVVPSTGYTFAGVSTNAATAGGAGIVQVNGVAKLNSDYNSSQSYVSFDSTNPNFPYGVRGSVVGLNVTLQGS